MGKINPSLEMDDDQEYPHGLGHLHTAWDVPLLPLLGIRKPQDQALGDGHGRLPRSLTAALFQRIVGLSSLMAKDRENGE